MSKKREMLGQVAIRKGYLTLAQVDEAVALQKNGMAGKLLGLILLERGMISNDQLIDVLREIRATATSRWLKNLSKTR